VHVRPCVRTHTRSLSLSLSLSLSHTHTHTHTHTQTHTHTHTHTQSPMVVFPDANIENAVRGAMMANFYTMGEVCRFDVR